MALQKSPKIIFIDWNKTLSYSKFWGHLEKSDKTLFNRIQTCLFDKNKDLIDPWMIGKLSSEEICKRIANDLSLSFDQIYKEFIKSCRNMHFSSKNIPKIIKELRISGIKVYIATDNMDSFDRWTVPSMKLDRIFDGIINSNKIGVLKKTFDKKNQSSFITRILKQESIEPSESILIDDNQDILNLFSKYGMGCIKIYDEIKLDNILTTLQEQIE